ncbi:ATP-grasp domain-containing protein [Brevibacillus humidisoli]|uniref:ATP-grasp domain-containing protein n=1 Tax=Brevibacillus humidisoli TaxID=2895522 RepID=UPI001E3A8369|nr:ATP-grasp domain-containing protein [Brevibacillus humidisoli]UFJ43129.1 ATP-grasp domain-containing protein [Brevibacillus humidisoli]
MKQKKLLMVTPWLRFVRKAKEEGFYFIALWDKRTKGNIFLPEIAKLADELYVFDVNNFDRLESMIESIHTREPLDYIYHLGLEENMLQTYAIAEKYGCAINSSQAISVLNDKYRMRTLLQAHGISTVRFQLVEKLQAVPQMGEEFGFPLVLKPTQLSGSRGVCLCHHQEDVRRWMELMETYQHEGPFLMEEYLHGPEVSVETVTVEGQHHVIGITDKIKTPPPLFVEVGHIHPSQLPMEQQAQIREMVVRFLTAADYRFGPAHTELILTPEGPKIVESQARLGGDRIPKLVHLSTGIELESAIFKGIKGIHPPASTMNGVAMIKYFQWKPGTIQNIEGIDAVQELPYVVHIECTLRPGDVVPEIRDSASRYGYMIVLAKSYEEAIEQIDTAMSMIRVTFEEQA